MPPRDLFSLLPTKIKMRLRFREFVRRTSFRHIDSKMHKLLKKNVKKSPNGGPSRDRVISDGDDLKFTPLSMNDDDEFDGSIARNGVIEMSSPTSSEIEVALLAKLVWSPYLALTDFLLLLCIRRWLNFQLIKNPTG